MVIREKFGPCIIIYTGYRGLLPGEPEVVPFPGMYINIYSLSEKAPAAGAQEKTDFFITGGVRKGPDGDTFNYDSGELSFALLAPLGSPTLQDAVSNASFMPSKKDCPSR